MSMASRAVRPPTLHAPASAAPAAAGPAERPNVVLDIVAGCALAGLVGWAHAVAVLRGGDAAPLRNLALAAACAYAAARWISSLNARAVPAIVVATAGFLALFNARDLLASPLGSPLGYANATAAFFALAATAAAVFAVLETRRAFVLAGWCAAAGAAAVPWLIGSLAGAFATILVAAAVAITGERSLMRRRQAVAVCLAMVVAANVASVVLASACDGASGCPVPDAIARALSLNRPRLWNDAIEGLAAEPVTGVGPGQFAARSPTALADADLAYAHSALLQTGAELGVPGVLLATALIGSVFLMLSRHPRSRGRVIVAAGVTGLLLQATIDYVLDFPVVVATAGALVGAAVGARRRETPTLLTVTSRGRCATHLTLCDVPARLTTPNALVRANGSGSTTTGGTSSR